jgi:cytochrome c-type biogenesis protein CcmE
MNPRRKQRLYLTILGVVGFSLITGLILYSAGQNMDLFYTPSEIVNGKNETGIKPKVGERLRIGGLVVTGSVRRDEKSLDVSFDLMDIGPIITVTYTGILPDLFREGQGIIAQGHLTSTNEIKAFEVLAKHDEEYMSPEVAEALKGIKHVKGDYSKTSDKGKG